jgi:sulfate permease, SulP family
MRNYQRGWLRGDVLAGVTVTAYLIPQVMAYAEVAGLPAVVGLWASVAALMVYAVFGSSPQLSVGPESTTALMTATALGGIAAGQPERYAALAAALAGLVGLFCLVAWAARLGFLAELLSRPVLVGYMSGVAVLMVISQLGKFTGLSVEGDTPLAEIVFVLEHLRNADTTTLLLAVAVLTFLLVGSRLFPRAPVPLIGMLLAAGVVVLFDLQDRGITVVDPSPGSSRPCSSRTSSRTICVSSFPQPWESPWWRSPTTFSLLARSRHGTPAAWTATRSSWPSARPTSRSERHRVSP